MLGYLAERRYLMIWIVNILFGYNTLKINGVMETFL